MSPFFRIILPTAFLLLTTPVLLLAQETGGAAKAPVPEARQAEEYSIPGQEAIATINDLDEAVDQLYAFPLPAAELDTFLDTMSSLEAWARANQWEWNGMFSSFPILKALRGLTFWRKTGQPAEPFATTLAKAYLLYSFVDPEVNAEERAREYIDTAYGWLDSGELSEEEIAEATSSIALAEEHLVQLASVPQPNRELYLARQQEIDQAMETWMSLDGIEEQPPIAFTMSSIGLQMRSSGKWDRDFGVADDRFYLQRPGCQLDILTSPWFEEDVLDSRMVNAILVGLLSGSETLEIGEQSVEEIDGRPQVRIPFLDGESDGLVAVTAVKDLIYIMVFRAQKSAWGLLSPMLDECLAHLEFGDYPTPLLVDRAEVGYQVYADAPWVEALMAPEATDRSLSCGDLPLSLDIAVLEGIGFGSIDMAGAARQLSELSGTRFQDATVLEPCVIELDGHPCAVTESFGTGDEETAEVFGVMQHAADFYVLNGSRLIHIAAWGSHAHWEEIQPLLDHLLQQMSFPVAAADQPTLILDRTEVGYQVTGRPIWQIQDDHPDDVDRALLCERPTCVVSFMAFPGTMAEEALPGILEGIQKGSFEQLVDGVATDSEIIEFHGHPYGIVETHGVRAEGKEFQGIDLHLRELVLVTDQHILYINIRAKQEDWEKAAPLVEELLQGLEFADVP